MCGPAAAGVGMLTLLILSPGVAKANDDAKRQFVTSCGVCHTAEKDATHRQGPNLFGIFGKQAGKIAEFKYSEVLAKADLTWDEATLDRWIEDAEEPDSVEQVRRQQVMLSRLLDEPADIALAA